MLLKMRLVIYFGVACGSGVLYYRMTTDVEHVLVFQLGEIIFINVSWKKILNEFFWNWKFVLKLNHPHH